MQSRSSLRLVHWALLSVMAAALASACVVSSGDGDDDDTDISEGGSDGSGATSASGGKAGSGGSGGTAGSTGGTAVGGTPSSGTPSAGAGGEGAGATSGYVAGLCQENGDPIEPEEKLSCAATPEGTVDDCVKCMKANCCEAWQTCYGDAPATACGSGATVDDPGQFLCVRDCFEAGADAATDLDQLLSDCTDECVGECSLINQETSDLIGCAYVDSCKDECFPVLKN